VTIERMDHVGIVVDDLPAAIEFFLELGMELQGEGSGEGDLVDRIVGLEGVRSDFAFLQTPDGQGKVELVKFLSPPAADGNSQAPVNATGLRHLTFAVDDVKAVLARLEGRGAELIGELVRYEDIYWLCYVRGPEGIVVELAEKID
jgi:catechol 2,3-dioxygenase-like lactoylglutathione lyase family enzyme